MERIKNRATEMVFQQRPSGTLGMMTVLVLLGLGIPTGIYLNSGTDTIACDRIEPTIVNCEISQSRPFNMLAEPTFTLSGVQEAVIESETREDDEGDDYWVYRVNFYAKDGLPHPVTDFERGHAWPQSIVTQMNTLLPSTDPAWEIIRAKGLPPLGIWAAFGVSGLVAGALAFNCLLNAKTLTLTLDKTQHKGVYTIETPLGWGDRAVEYNFSDLDVNLTEYEGEYGQTYCKLELLANDGEAFYRQDASNFVELQPRYEELCNFLGLAVKPISVSRASTQPASTPLPAPKVFYIGQRSAFSNRGLMTMPDTADAASRTAANVLDSLVFAFVGDLHIDALPGLELYGFANPQQASYAVIINGSQPEQQGVDCYTTFADGTSLTTTTMDVATKQMKSKKIYRYSYPGIDVTNLLRKHQNHLTELMQTHGKPNPVKADLKAIAIAIDEYLVREASAKPMLFGIQL
jgi:hypothetical protein